MALWQNESDGLSYVLVTDTRNNRICVHRFSDGAFVRKFPSSIPLPIGIAVSTTHDTAFVTQFESNRVTMWRIADGSYLGRWCSYGVEQFFSGPYGVAVSPNSGLVFVTESIRHRVQVFRPDGSFVRWFGGHGDKPGQLDLPTGIAVCNGLVYVADYNNHRISVFTESDGTFVRHVGNGKGTDDGQLFGPRGLVATDGWVAVSEYNNGRISLFSALDGSFVSQWGSASSVDRGLTWPDMMCWGTFNEQSVLLVADSDNHRIVVYE